MIDNILEKMNSFEAIKNILFGITLHDVQCIDVMKMLYSKKAIVSYDTGTGKTLLAAAVMRLLWNENPSRRFIVFVKKDQLVQTPLKLEAATHKKVIATSGEASSVENTFWSNDFLDAPILMLTHSCLRNKTVMRKLFSVKDKYCGVIIDEAHEISNTFFAQSADMIKGMLSQFEFGWALTATPITTDVSQMCKLANLMNPERYPDPKRLANRVKRGQFSITDDPMFFINRNGAELGRNSHYYGFIQWVNAMPHQHQCLGGNALMELCKGDGAQAQAESLVNLVKQYSGKKGLIYVNQHSVREWIIPFLENAGIKYGCINGKTSSTEDAEIMYQFNECNSLDVVITSCTTAIDLDCDFVIFYEFTVMLKQMIGRADRGLSGSTVDVWYIITRGSYEPEYFKKTIVDRSTMIRDLLNKDYSELESIVDEVEVNLSAGD